MIVVVQHGDEQLGGERDRGRSRRNAAMHGFKQRRPSVLRRVQENVRIVRKRTFSQ